MDKFWLVLIGLVALCVALVAGGVVKNVQPEPVAVEPILQGAPTGVNNTLDGMPPSNKTWLSPGKIQVDNFYPGARAEYPLTIHNGKDADAQFSIIYRQPDNALEGYTCAPSDAQYWVTIVDDSPMLAPFETKEIPIIVEMPKTAKVDTKKWEFWISVGDTTQKGNVITEICSRWLIDMR